MAGGLTLVDVMDAVHTRLLEVFDTPDTTVWPHPPNVEGRLPAVWPEALLGGGVNTRDRPVTIRLVYVPAPAANGVQWPDAWSAVDRLDDGFSRPLPGGIAAGQRSWTFDTVAPGDITRDALHYDLALTYPAC